MNFPRRGLKITAILVFLVIAFISFLLWQPTWVIYLLAHRSPGVVYHQKTLEPVVALTIDDGPDAETSAEILDILHQHDARATFFLISERIPGNEALVTRMLDDGHEIGNHLAVDQAHINVDPTEFERQLLEADSVLSDFSDARWIRPGSGFYNAGMLSTISKHNYKAVLGSVYPFDPHIPSSFFAAKNILWNVKPGSIIILHDSGKRGKRTAATLSKILPELKRRGYRVVNVSELVESQQKQAQEERLAAE